jgi:hypothetical protein
MGRMTIGARGRDREAASEESFAMNALSIPGNDLVLFAGVSDRRFLSFTMTLGTQIRNIHRKDRRLGISSSTDAVCAMTFQTRRRIYIALGRQLAMKTLPVFLADLLVASGAINFLLRQVLARAKPRWVDSGVALAARHFCMA